MLELLRLLRQSDSEEAGRLLAYYQSYPTDLPRLSTLMPPGGNTRPEGIAASAYERRQRGELPDTY